MILIDFRMNMTMNTVRHTHEQTLQTVIHSNHYIRSLIQRNIIDFSILHEEILDNTKIRDLTVFRDALSALKDRLRTAQQNSSSGSNKIQLAICGENSSGKTAFLHTFLGIGKILPSGDGPVTARITKLTYAPSDQARICIRKTIRYKTLVEEEINLSSFFTSEKPNWTGVGRALLKHVKRPQDLEEMSHEFVEWVRCFVEIYIPSPMLAMGIDVYDTPGFFLDEAPVLKEILRDLMELIHPTLVFMYSNPSTDDATKDCFLAMKIALYGLDSDNIFFLNSKADLHQMSTFKKDMTEEEFLSTLADERTRRYNLLSQAPFLANNRLEGLPQSIDECRCFDICSVNSQSIKPYGPLMNEITIQRIIQFVANNDLTVAKHACRLVLPIIDSFFNFLLLNHNRSTEYLLQLHFDALNWGKHYFQAYKMCTEVCLQYLFSRIFQLFDTEEKSIVQIFLNTRNISDPFDHVMVTAVRVQIIQPAIRETLRKLKGYVLEHITSNSDLIRGAALNEILIGALGRQELSDFVALLLDDHFTEKYATPGIVYMGNTISTPILQCAQHLQNLYFYDFSTNAKELVKISKLSRDRNDNYKEQITHFVHEYLINMQKIIKKQRNTMWQVTELWGNQQEASLRSLIDFHYNRTSPRVDSHQEILNYLEKFFYRLVVIECGLCAAQDMARFSGSRPQIRSVSSTSTVFSTFTIDWGSEKNLLVKKLSRPITDQPIAAYYEAHYHLRLARLCHSNIVNLRYLYEHHLEDETSELWIIFPPLMQSLEQFLQQISTSLSIKMVIRWMIEIADALAVLHKNELIHRNVVLSNIILAEDQRTLLIDLGNWCGDCDISMRHHPSSTLNGMNDDIKGFGLIGQTLSSHIKQDDNVLAIINEFNELIFKCTGANSKKPVTIEFVQNQLKFILDMF